MTSHLWAVRSKREGREGKNQRLLAPLLFSFLFLFSLMLATACEAGLSPAAAQPAPPLQWEPVHDGLRPHAPVASIAFDPHQPHRVAIGLYAPTGLLLSEDGGEEWRQDLSLAEAVHAVHFDQILSGVLWVAGAHGLWRIELHSEGRRRQAATGWPAEHAAFTVTQSSDGVRYAAGVSRWDEAPTLWRSLDGETWRSFAPLPTPTDGAVLALAAANDRLFAGTDGFGLFASDGSILDNDFSWRRVEEIGETHVAALWASADGSLLLARTRKGLFRSADSGATWRRVDLPLEGRPDAIAVAPDGAMYLGMGGGEILRSDDAGASWRPWSTLDRDGLFYALAVDPFNADRLFAGTQHGLYFSLDVGRTWRPLESVGERRGRTLLEAGGSLFLGAEDGVYRWEETIRRWERLGEGLPLRQARTLAASPANPSILFVGTDAGLYRSLDAGATWRLVGWPQNGVNGLLFDPGDPNRLYMHIAFERVYRTNEALGDAPTWDARWEGMPISAEVLSLAMEPGNPHRLYAGAAQGLYIGDERAERWRNVPALTGRSLFTIVVDPLHHQRVYAGATDGLYRSEDRGETWERLGLQDVTVTALAWNERQPQLLYAGTKYQGLWRSVDAGRTWEQAPFDEAAQDESINALLLSADGRWLYAATTRGVWRAALGPE
ncbi:MAG: hypothetical protein NZ553_02915 [Caldilinea sp.]|nr:hypothetical protein [Caldilinea sp.]MDW8439402.1 hypothetical protein [Caldilineaceae bacterium]